MSGRTELQLQLLERMARLVPPPRIMGGYAEDGLIARRVTREHEDVDWITPRSELPLRLDQARELGFKEFETWGESSPGEAFYIYADRGDLTIDIGVSDDAGGSPVVDVYKLAFMIEGKEPPGGYRIHLPADMFDQAAVDIEGVQVWPVSPLALYQLRVGIASMGSFGELNEKQRSSLRRLKDAFFPERSDEELAPTIEPLERMG